MTTSKKKASIGLVKGIVAPDTEGYIDIADLLIDGEPLGKHLQRMVALQHLLKDVSTRLDDYKSDILAFLLERGYNIKPDDIKGLKEALKEVYTLSPHNTHYIAKLKDSYVEQVIAFELNELILNDSVPNDVLDGYYTVKHGKFVLDETRKEELEGLE